MADLNGINKPGEAQEYHQAYIHPGNKPEASGQSLQLSWVLQSTLELNKLLQLFDQELACVIAHDGFHYENKEDNLFISIGDKAPCRCSYQLLLQDKEIGVVNFYRASKFSDQEKTQLETMISALIYPLRNALLYNYAVEKAHRDPVTGVNNRTALDSDLAQEINLAKRHTIPLSIIIFDLDKFKQINDTYGHIAGDILLKRVADCMVTSVRGSDIIYRYGGEEFVVLLRNTEKPGAKLLAERIRKAVESMHLEDDGLKAKITLSAGLTSLGKNDSVVSFLERCDEALYKAKQAGRNCVIVAETD